MKAARNNRVVCQCNGVTENDIVKILKKGARHLEDVRKFTLASTGCGRCKADTESIVDHFMKLKKLDLQQNIEF